MRTLFSELRRRHVFRVAAVYGVVAWLLIQIADTTFPAFGAPDWVLRVVIALAALGFPIAVVLAWAFELTPNGVRRAEPVGAGSAGSAKQERGRSVGRWAASPRAAGWMGVGIILGLATVGAYGLMRVPTAGTDEASEAGATRSVAVLPFASVSSEPGSEYFAEGIAEEILNALSHVPQLRVAARTSAFSFRGSAVPMDSIGRALGVENVLEGTVRAVGDRVRITVRLVEAATGDPLWSKSYDREAIDILAVQEEIAVAIANALQVRLAGERASLTRSRTADPVAYELYLQGRHLGSTRTAEGLTESARRFEAAIERDPAFAAAYSGLADAYALLEDYAGMPREEAFPKAIAAAERALELDELQAEAHTSLGHIYFHQSKWEAAERSYLRALELNPSYATAYAWYGNLMVALRRMPEGVEALERAYELDPFSPAIRRTRGPVLYYAREFEQAAAWYVAQMESNPDHADLHNWLARVHLATGNHAGAIAAMERVLELIPADQPDVWAKAQLAAAYAAEGRRAEAVRILEEVERLPADHGADSRIAVAYGYLGDFDRAFQWLGTAVERGDWMVGVMQITPMLDPLRQDARFAALLERAEQRPVQ